MRTHLVRWLLTTGLVTGIATVAAADPEVRDHRHDVDFGPREAPPPVRLERFEPRAGYAWVPGRWQWHRGRYEWMNGHYEREHMGKKWREGRWERRGDAFVFVDGEWIDLGPTNAPPALREEVIAARPGFIFVRGRWDWRNGSWEWLPGHWERAREGKKWREARWELREGRYVLVEGEWFDVPLYPTAAPPELRIENPIARPGFMWVRGRWTWRDGEWAWLDGHWERERFGHRWIEGRWEPREGRYVWVEGNWTPVRAEVIVRPR
jgi:hypothetical protein